MSGVPAAALVAACELCEGLAGATPAVATLDVATLRELRVVRAVDTPAFPAFYRVIWRAHVAEWTDLDRLERTLCMDVVALVERALRKHLAPCKVNLASLGNLVPHLHWHVVARFDWDTHFPQPIWGTPQRALDATPLSHVRDLLPAVDAQVAQTVARLGNGS